MTLLNIVFHNKTNVDFILFLAGKKCSIYCSKMITANSDVIP